MSVSKLVQLLPPPENPIECGTSDKWENVRSSMNVRLPIDYFEYGITYGSGSISNGFFVIANWAAPHYFDFIQHESNLVRAAGTSSQQEQIRVFPDCPGLLPWGADENGSSLCWFTSGDSSNWPIVIQAESGEQYQYDLSMTEFLVEIFGNRIQCPVWHEPFRQEELIFHPSPQ